MATLIEFMDYTLAKKLKDAGFPMEYFEQIGVTAGVIPNFPTLSELIDACGERFESLLKTNTKEGCEWSARGYNYPTTGYLSPEEAVANLWLVINK